MNEQYLGYAPAYQCPGCHAELSAGNTSLEHLNRCAVLLGMIANDGGYVVRNTAAGRQKELLRGSKQPRIREIATALRSREKAHDPALWVSGENAGPVEMDLSAPMRVIADGLLIHPSNVKPHLLLDVLIEVMSLASDAALSRKLRVPMDAIYKCRSGKLPISSQMLMRMHEASGIPLQELHALMAETKLPAPARKKVARPHHCVKPHRLLDAVIRKMHLKNDAALSRMLGMHPPTISKMRNGILPIGASILMRMHETTDIPIRRLRALMPADASGRGMAKPLRPPTKPVNRSITQQYYENQKYLTHLVQYPR